MLDDANTSQPLAHFDPFGLPYREDPAAFFPVLLANSPALIEVGGKPALIVSAYAHVRAALNDFKSFSSAKPQSAPGMEKVDFFNGFPVMGYSDPPRHTYLRRIVGPAFSAGRLKAIKDRAKEIGNELLAALGEHPSFDGVQDLGLPFAKRLLTNHFMGVPKEDEHVFLNYVKALAALDKTPPSGERPKEFLDAWNAGTEYCGIALERARRDKTDNLVKLIADAADGGKITEGEILATMMSLYGGGLGSVSGGIGAALGNLARYPDIAERIRRDPELAERHFEETIRLDLPLHQVMRFASDDMTFEGLAVGKGTPVYVMLAAACVDGREFPEPDKFDIDRPNNKEHIAFGGGVHTCVGNALARMVVAPLIADVAQRYPGLRLRDPDKPFTYDSGIVRTHHLVRAPLVVS